MDDGTEDFRYAFIFSLKADGSFEFVAPNDIDNKRVPVDIAPKLDRARVHNSLRVIRGGKSE